MVNCPKCLKQDAVKAGTVRDKQRYKCKNCIYYYTDNNKGSTAIHRRRALELYLEGLGFRSIGRLLNVSHVSVYNWIKAFGSKLKELQSAKEVLVMEIDEMHSYIKSKKMLVGSGLLLIDMGKDSSTLLLEIEKEKLASSYGAR